MLKIDRHRYIESLLSQNGSVLVTNLSDFFNCSEETIRRDLEELEQQNKIKRVRGGGYLPDHEDREVPIQIRETIYNQEKDLIAQKALKFIEEDDVIMLDASTTAIQLAKLLIDSKKKVTIITNSLKISNLFESKSLITLICLGGKFRNLTSSFVGYITTESLSLNYADKAFISASTINKEYGITDNNFEESVVRKKMMHHSKQTFLIVDHTKFSEPSKHIISDFKKIDYLITDKKVEESWHEMLMDNGVKVVIDLN